MSTLVYGYKKGNCGSNNKKFHLIFILLMHIVLWKKGMEHIPVAKVLKRCPLKTCNMKLGNVEISK